MVTYPVYVRRDGYSGNNPRKEEKRRDYNQCADETVRSLESWRRQAVEVGPESLLAREYPSRPQTRKLDGKGQAQLITLACSRAPDGRDHWTLRLLAQRMVGLETVNSISHETVRRVLKKQPEAVAEAAMVYCPGSERGVYLPDGAGAGAVLAAL